jgi:uncharacterized membrane protein YfcA
MADLAMYQYVLIAFAFIWSGIVRSALGFGGAVLSLPFLLLIYDEPLVFLPIIAVHLVIFSFLTIYRNHQRSKKTTEASSVDWRFLGYALGIMIISKLVGVFGLISLPGHIMSTVILVIISVYALSYILNRPFKSKNKVADVIFLVIGGYVSGTSLIGAPVVVAVFSKYVDRYRLRDTLLALWFILVIIKLASFVFFDIDLQLIHHFWLLPCAGVGHLIGLKLHNYLLDKEGVQFYRILGLALLTTSLIGLYQAWL